VTGVDLSDELLEHARQSAPEARFERQDMRELDVRGEPFEAVTCLFDSIGYALNDEGVVATLTAVSSHLAPGGFLVLEYLHAPALLREASALRVRRFDLSDHGDELMRISRTQLDVQRRIMEVEFELLELRSDGTYDRWLETQRNRFFSVSEMHALLERAELEVVRLVPAYRDDDRIDDETFHVIAVARRAE
jgi:trans-aconitate methyltransferase